MVITTAGHTKLIFGVDRHTIIDYNRHMLTQQQWELIDEKYGMLINKICHAISGDEAILLGSGGSATGIEARYGAMLIFHVPAAGSENRVTLLGATQQLLTAIALGQ